MPPIHPFPFSYTFPITFDIGYFIEVDWNKAGNFDGAGVEGVYKRTA